MADTIPKLLQKVVEEHPDVAAQMSKDQNGSFESRSFLELYNEVRYFFRS